MNNPHEALIPIDGGPVYHETVLGRVIAEPWNAASSLLLLIPVALLLWKVRGEYRKHFFIVLFCAPLLAAGGLGSTLFHAFRISVAFLLLDVLPVLILTIGVSIFFLYRLAGNWQVPVIIILGSFGLRWLTQYHFGGQDAINIYYVITGALIFIPGLLFLLRTKGRAWKWVASASLLFLIAIVFRYTDDLPDPGLSMGTHWLWHVFCAAGAYALGMYIINVSQEDAPQASTVD